MSESVFREVIEKAVLEFLSSRQPKNNPRSTTGVRKCGKAAYHFKTGEGNLADEAGLLRKAGELIQLASVRSVPFAYFNPRMNVLVTRYVEGEILFNKIWNATSLLRPDKNFTRALPEAARNLARWLRLFHDIRPNFPGDIEAVSARKEWLKKNMADKADGVARYGAGILTREELRRIMGRIDGLMAEPAWFEVPICTVHGDFSLSNIIYSGDNLCYVSDFGNAHPGFAWEDAARFWSGLWEISRVNSRRRKLIVPAMEEFLSVFGLGANALNSAVWTALLLNNSLTSVHVYVKPGFRVPWRLNRILGRLAFAHLDWLRKFAYENRI